MHLKERFEELGINLKTKTIFGPDVFANIANSTSHFGKKALIVTTSRYLIRSGVITQLLGYLKARGIICEVSKPASANPKTHEINAICSVFKNKKIDFIIGIGGGSSIDAAKAIAVLLGSGKDNIENYLLSGEELPVSTLPIVAIPTTAGSGSEVSQAAIITDEKKILKLAIRGKYIIPSLAALDPMLTLTVPYELTKFSGFDVFTHAFESFISKKSTPFSEKLSKEAMRIVIEVLPQLLRDLSNLELRSQMMFASLIAGVNLIDVGTCLPHRMQYPMGALTDMPHGLGLAILYPAWIKKVREAKLEKLKNLDTVFRKCKEKCDPLDKIEEFLTDLDMENHLKKKYSISENIESLTSKVKNSLENDPVYRPGVVEEIYAISLRKEA